MAVLSTLVATVAYGWGIGGNPANFAYAATVRSMSMSWHNFFYGAYDPLGYLSIDKAPGALWPQALSVLVFGYGPGAMILPNTIAGAAAVAVLFALVRRWAGHTPAAIASIVMAATPIVVAADRVNVPDGILIFVLVAAAYTFWRAVEVGSPLWLLPTAALLGYGFDVKLMIAVVILPVLGIVYLVCAPGAVGRRTLHVLGAGVLTAALASIWPLVVAFTPAASRPYVDGSTTNSVWEMIFEYNLFGRANAPVADPQSAELPVLGDGQVVPVDQGGAGGPLRLFNEQVGGQISWLIPLAVLLAVVGLFVTWRAARTDLQRAGWLLWGGWLAVYGVALSVASDIHPYYTVLLAPPLAALVGAGLYQAATSWTARGLSWVLPLGLLLSGGWAYLVLDRSPEQLPWLRPVVAAAALLAAAGFVLYRRGTRSGGLAIATGALAAVALLAGPIAWSGYVFSPSADPRAALFQSINPVAGPDGNAMSAGFDLSALSPAPGAAVTAALPPVAVLSAMPPFPDPKLLQFLMTHRQGEKFVVAAVGGAGSSPYIQAGVDVMPMGGFGGTTPYPTKDEFVAAVRAGEVRYVLFGGFSYDSPTSLERKDWILANCSRVDPADYASTSWMAATSVLFDCR